uniref:Uncharacterized protein n=1 Tax=Moniliophthora roreri TaxID=221103 RepID=A0A0W0F624_MONRR
MPFVPIQLHPKIRKASKVSVDSSDEEEVQIVNNTNDDLEVQFLSFH